VLVRTASPSLAASEYAAVCGGTGGSLNSIDLERERRLLEGLIEAVGMGLIRSAHDVSDGGIVVALAEACFGGAQFLGAEVTELGETPTELYGEGASTVIVAMAAENLEAFRGLFARLEVRTIGRVTTVSRLKIPKAQIDREVAALQRLHEEALPRRLASK
jgi:phosphoribosylformylglycinamidine synthase